MALQLQYNSTNTTYGSYCFSKDGRQCLYDYGKDCDPKDQSNCTTIDGVHPIKVGYFLTNNNQQVLKDVGAPLCNFNGTDD